ncbi:MAG: peptide chain release factor 3, partial [Myxococcaceae bacterium]|nr:peptide chain release factor 3 [Myxococcaceae bacterium]
MSDAQLDREIARRRTFAIISHPDAGKTTLTEKLLLYGGAIHLAGSVKARRKSRHATSDWMELEKQRGISVTSSVLQFEHDGFAVNILDTPGHQDFSEDTYRTLAATDAAVMLIDGAKGVEAQTRKLFQVCRKRRIPIFTFINKLDRDIRPPLDLLDELESLLGIRSTPINWPIGCGSAFKGVFDRHQKRFLLFEGGSHGARQAEMTAIEEGDPSISEVIGQGALDSLREELELLDVAGDPFDLDRVLQGELTPVFFGSAMTNFGVLPFLEGFLRMAPPPRAYRAVNESSTPVTAPVASENGQDALERTAPNHPAFSGFIFKIQANMDPAHRDRVAFLRICTGRFVRGMSARHVRLDKEIKLANPQQFMAQDRQTVDEAYPGDIVGLFDPGHFRIGDTLCAGTRVEYAGIPSFSPEHFASVRLKEALKRKQLLKGLEQLSQEGAIQLFQAPGAVSPEPIVGAVGQLQFDVLRFRLEHEYGVAPILDALPFVHARWVESGAINPSAAGTGDS